MNVLPDILATLHLHAYRWSDAFFCMWHFYDGNLAGHCLDAGSTTLFHQWGHQILLRGSGSRVEFLFCELRAGVHARTVPFNHLSHWRRPLRSVPWASAIEWWDVTFFRGGLTLIEFKEQFSMQPPYTHTLFNVFIFTKAYIIMSILFY